MLDLWFGLDASGFDNASEFFSPFISAVELTEWCFSQVSPHLRANHDDYIRMLEQYPPSDRYVLFNDANHSSLTNYL